jgi:calcium-dependent protein kinase
VGSIAENYKVGQILGEGAFGQVCKVIHKSTGMVRAMKTLKKSSLIKEEEEKLFSEMNILKNLDHPNILKLIELF